MIRTAAIVITLMISAYSPALAESIQGDVAFSNGDYVAAFKDWHVSAEAGDASAMLAIGVLYDTGHGVLQDFSQALEWYRRAANAGSVHGMFNVAVMYDAGRGTAINRQEAVRWYTKAAEQGHGRAAYNLGLIYRDGDGVAKNREQAIRMFLLAAANGIEAAKTNLKALGSRVPIPAVSGHDVDQQPIITSVFPAPAGNQSLEGLAIRFQQISLTRASIDPDWPKIFAGLLPGIIAHARNGDMLAEYEVGFAYQYGIGIPLDPVRSYVSYLRATTASNPEVKSSALAGASQIAGLLTSEQHARARDILIGARF